MEQKYTSYKITNRYGVDDLKSEYPYHGEWSHFSPSFDITEEDYKKDVEGYVARVKEYNTSYIKQLIEEGRYKEEYVITFNMMHNPMFNDQPKSEYSNFGILIPNGNGEDRKFNIEYGEDPKGNYDCNGWPTGRNNA